MEEPISKLARGVGGKSPALLCHDLLKLSYLEADKEVLSTMDPINGINHIILLHQLRFCEY